MSDDNDPIGKALNLSQLPSGDAVKSLIEKSQDSSAKNDFEMARTNIHEVIQNGVFAMEKLSQIADSSQHPRAFEVLAKLMDTMLQANKDLLSLQKDIREIETTDQSDGGEKQITNNLFVGSTSELQKMIDGMRKQSD